MMNNCHNSKLVQHFRDKIFWLDIFILTLLVGISFSSLLNQYEVWANVLRITTLIAGLELIGFLSFHLLEDKKGLLAQGFLGGFVSSTLTFIEFTHNKDFRQYSPLIIAQSLIFATISMAIQSVLIVINLVPLTSYILLLTPFILYAMALLICIPFLQLKIDKNPHLHTSYQSVLEERPIIWKKVFTFSAVMVALIYGMRFLSQTLSMPYELSAFIVSLFEAHGVLAAGLSEIKSSHQLENAQTLVLIVLTGQTLSKMALVWRSSFSGLVKPMFSCLTIATILSWLAILF